MSGGWGQVNTFLLARCCMQLISNSSPTTRMICPTKGLPSYLTRANFPCLLSTPSSTLLDVEVVAGGSLKSIVDGPWQLQMFGLLQKHEISLHWITAGSPQVTWWILCVHYLFPSFSQIICPCSRIYVHSRSVASHFFLACKWHLLGKRSSLYL